MTRITNPAPTLADHAHRPIRAFLDDPRIRDTALENDFFDAVYGVADVDHDTALETARELLSTPRRVGEVLDGTWKPAAIAGATS